MLLGMVVEEAAQIALNSGSSTITAWDDTPEHAAINIAMASATADQDCRPRNCAANNRFLMNALAHPRFPSILFNEAWSKIFAFVRVATIVSAAP
eukprot:306201-Amphidinium_carterae.1